MKKLTLHLCLAVLAFLSAAKVQAQSLEAIKAQMVKDWERAKAYTQEYLNTMPADKYSFKANDSTRSFAQQMLHLAAANVMLMSNVTTNKIPAGISFSLEQRASAQTKDSVVYYITTSYDFARDAVAYSDVSKWWDVKKIFGRFDETVFAMMNKTFEHQTHHRGQTTIYIRLVGVKPPNERLF